MNDPQKSGPRNSYQVKIPKDATPEEIKEFMKEFMKKWNKGSETTEQSSKPEQA